MNLNFNYLKCPVCGAPLLQGNAMHGVNIELSKYCENYDITCNFWMVITIPASAKSTINAPSKRQTNEIIND